MEVLKSVLKEGFWPRYCLEDVKWQGYPNTDFVAFPMVCFCDIPLSRLSEHVLFYGSFGIGLTKEWGVRNNLNPVIYFSGSNPLHGALQSLINVVGALEEPEKSIHVKNVRHILGHSKPIKGHMWKSGVRVPKDFYQESEWRYVPQHEDVFDRLGYELFEEYVDVCNKKTAEHCMIKFESDDVRYIFVPEDTDIPEVMEFIESELTHFSPAAVKLLMSRVTSLQSIALDV